MVRKRINTSPLRVEVVKEGTDQYVKQQPLFGEHVEHPYSGQRCPRPGCDGVLHVESTKIFGDYRLRYLKCAKCGVAPEKHIQIVPLEHAPRQSTRRHILGRPPYPNDFII
jgi:hypothetical protein